VVIPVLKAVRRARGIETAVRCAEEMIVATVSIIARKSGPERAREVCQFHAKSGQFHAMRVLARAGLARTFRSALTCSRMSSSVRYFVVRSIDDVQNLEL
jgi:hypothetical protein